MLGHDKVADLGRRLYAMHGLREGRQATDDRGVEGKKEGRQILFHEGLFIYDVGVDVWGGVIPKVGGYMD